MNRILRFEQAWTQVYPDKIYLLRAMRDAIATDCVEWVDLTTSNLTTIADYIAKTVTSNSCHTYFAFIKAFLNRYKDDGIIPCKAPSKVFKARKTPSQHIALTEDEVLLWDRYIPQNECENDVKIIFMRGCLTGARHSDCIRMSMKNVRDGKLRYVSQKTKTEVCQPVHHLLTKYLEVQPAKEHKTAVINRIISRICKNLGIDEEVTLFVKEETKTGPKYEFVSSHTSRHTFITNLALRNVPLSVMKTLAGHSDEKMTMRYIAVNVNKLDDNAMAFFEE